MYFVKVSVFIVVFLLLSCKSTNEEKMNLVDLVNILTELVIDHQIFDCSKDAISIIRFDVGSKRNVIDLKDVSILSKKYSVVNSRAVRFTEKRPIVQFSFRSDADEMEFIYMSVTCDFPKSQFYTEEPSIFRFVFIRSDSKNGNGWKLDRVDSLN